MRFAGRLLSVHRVKRNQLENVDGLQAKLFGDPQHSVVSNKPEVFLPQMQQWHGRASAVLRRIPPDGLIHFPLQLSGNRRVRRVCHFKN
jgi:hypothetical protein